MEVGDKNQNTDIAEINRCTVHELWEGGDSTRTFTKSEGVPRCIRVNSSGTLVLTDWQSSGVQSTYNVLQGELLPFIPKIIDTSSSADIHILW